MQERTEAAQAIYTDDSAIDIGRVGGALLSKLWAIVMTGLILAGLFYFFAKTTYIENYTASATLAFTTTSRIIEKDENGNEVGILTQKKPYTEKDVERYQFLLKSDVMVKKIYDALGEYDKTEIEKSLSVSGTSITGIFTINVTNADKKFCEDAIKVVIATFPDYLKSFDTSLGIDVIKNAKPPVVSNESQAAQKAFYGFVAGAALVIFIILISEVTSETVKQTDDIRSKINARVLGAVPTVEHDRKNRKKKKSSGSLLLAGDSKENFTFVESFKAIRTKVEAIAADKGYKLFVVTSTFEGEGKTTVAINLACALAQKGKSVLLVDCDLRKPSIMRTVGIKDDEKSGLIQIIQDKSTYIESIKFLKPLGIFILPSGGVSPKSTEVLDADKVKDVFDKATAEFDYIIIDTPPAHIVADCLVVAPLADAMIFTIKRDYAKISDINDTLDEISSADIDVIGTVLTMSNEEGTGRYFSRRGGLYYYYRRKKGYYKGYYKRQAPYGYEQNLEKKD
jgi:polysaccharide biosynthesis transport protein